MTDTSDRLAAALADHYRIIREIGAGGMATVYLAEDLKHHREVAVKVLRPELSATIGGERFLREIETVARFQHPHVLPLLDSGVAGGFLYYVMPYVDGDSLRDRLAKAGEFTIHDAVRILVEVTDALAYAHARGVVHRDIKPDNILMSGRHALVTDFGVSKALSEASGSRHVTTTGVALGTPAYMAPEQATADPNVDHRADIYAVGALGYELIAGHAPFRGANAQEVLAAHVTKIPEPLTSQRAACPPPLSAVIMKCLEKRPADRWQSADALLSALEPLATPSGGITPTTTRPIPAVATSVRSRSGVIAAVGLTALLAVGAWVVFGRSGPPQVTLGRATHVTLDAGLEIDPALSPDGRLVAYTAGPIGAMRVYVRQIAGGAPIEVTPSDTGAEAYPSWTPDGQRLLFLSTRGVEIVPALGGPPQLLVPGTWGTVFAGPVSPDGERFAYVAGDSMWSAALDGGTRTLITTGHEMHSIAQSPDGRWIAFVQGNPYFVITDPSNFGNIAPSAVRMVSAAGGESWAITDAAELNVSPAWGRDPRLLYFISTRDGARDLYALALSGSGRPSGSPVRMTTGANLQHIGVSRDGHTLAYSVFTETSNVYWVPDPGAGSVSSRDARPLTSGAQVIEKFNVSPDGSWLVFDSNRDGPQELFRMPMSGGTPERLTRDSGDAFAPAISPDGREILYHAFRNGWRALFVMPAAGGPATVAASREGWHYWLASWDPTGRRIAFTATSAAGASEVAVITRDSAGRWGDVRTVSTRALGDCTSGLSSLVGWSADGRDIVVECQANHRGVLGFASPDRDSSRLVWSDPNSVFFWPCPSADGRTLYALDWRGTTMAGVMAVPIHGGTPRLVVRFDDPQRPWHRSGYQMARGRFYFTLGDWESDIWVADLNSR